MYRADLIKKAYCIFPEWSRRAVRHIRPEDNPPAAAIGRSSHTPWRGSVRARAPKHRGGNSVKYMCQTPHMGYFPLAFALIGKKVYCIQGYIYIFPCLTVT